jgi:hypothetical protein
LSGARCVEGLSRDVFADEVDRWLAGGASAEELRRAAADFEFERRALLEALWRAEPWIGLWMVIQAPGVIVAQIACDLTSTQRPGTDLPGE